MSLLNSKRTALVLSVAAMFLASCTSSKKKKDFTYFNNLPEDSVYIVKDAIENKETKLMPGDIITIRVSTLDDKSTELFNQGVLSRAPGAYASATSTLQTDGYMLDKNGDINFPVFGRILLKGKTLEETQRILTQKISAEVKNPIVNVRLQNAIVTVMGEVGKPGPINISDRTTTVLEAIGRAGDIQPTGKKNDVKVIRRSNDGVTEYAILNLNNISATNSPYYFLQQGDIIVVNSNHVKERIVRGGLDNQQTIYLVTGGLSALAAITTAVVLINQTK